MDGTAQLVGHQTEMTGTMDGTAQLVGRQTEMTGTMDGTAQLVGRQTGKTGTMDGTAQLAERQTEMTGTILTATQVRLPGAAKGFFCQNQLSVQTHTVSAQPPPTCNHMHQRLCARKKIPNTGSPTTQFGRMTILHTLRGIGNTALAAAVPYPDQETKFPAGDNEVLFFFIFLCHVMQEVLLPFADQFHQTAS